MPHRARGRPSHLREELVGLLILAIGVFVALCLLSHDPWDPSWNTLAPARPVQNLGGVIGSYLSDTLLVLIGYASFLIPLGLVGYSLLLFFRKEVRFGWTALLIGIPSLGLASVLCGIQPSPFGPREIAPGGLVGDAAGALLVRAFGRSGTYLLASVGFLLAIVWVGRISVGRIASIPPPPQGACLAIPLSHETPVGPPAPCRCPPSEGDQGFPRRSREKDCSGRGGFETGRGRSEDRQGD